jgi:hypothetical protein
MAGNLRAPRTWAETRANRAAPRRAPVSPSKRTHRNWPVRQSRDRPIRALSQVTGPQWLAAAGPRNASKSASPADAGRDGRTGRRGSLTQTGQRLAQPEHEPSPYCGDSEPTPGWCHAGTEEVAVASPFQATLSHSGQRPQSVTGSGHRFSGSVRVCVVNELCEFLRQWRISSRSGFLDAGQGRSHHPPVPASLLHPFRTGQADTSCR